MTCKIWVSTEQRVAKRLTDDGFSEWQEEGHKLVDHADSSDRKWLTSHLHWAVRNNRRVLIEPESF